MKRAQPERLGSTGMRSHTEGSREGIASSQSSAGTRSSPSVASSPRLNNEIEHSQ